MLTKSSDVDSSGTDLVAALEAARSLCSRGQPDVARHVCVALYGGEYDSVGTWALRDLRRRLAALQPASKSS